MNTEPEQTPAQVTPEPTEPVQPVEESPKVDPVPETSKPEATTETPVDDTKPETTEEKLAAKPDVEAEKPAATKEEAPVEVAPVEVAPVKAAPVEEAPKEVVPPRMQLELDDRNLPICPKSKIQASDFFLGDESEFAVHCVLCSKDRVDVRRMPDQNINLSLVLNEKLADQLFNEKEFQEGHYETKIDNIIKDFKDTFEENCKNLKEQIMNRLANESHEFMLKKVKKFLDKARGEYKADPADFKKLQELCTTFNDFLLLKKSDEVSTASTEVANFEQIFKNMKRTLEVNFKYLKNKIEGNDDAKLQLKRSISRSETIKSSLPRKMETSVVVNASNYPVQTPRKLIGQNQDISRSETIKMSLPRKMETSVIVNASNNPVQTPTRNQVVQSNDTFFDNMPGSYGLNNSRPVVYANGERPKSSYSIQRNEHNRSVSPGLRTIKKVRKSQTSGLPRSREPIRTTTEPTENVRKTLIQTGNGVHSPVRPSSPSYTETVSHINGVKVIRRSISSSSRRSQPRPISDQQVAGKKNVVQFTSKGTFSDLQNTAPTFSSVDDALNKSQILSSPASKSFVKNELFPQPVSLNLLYSGARDGMSNEMFHTKSDQAGPTLCLFTAKETGAVFGGYNDRIWFKSDSGECLPSSQSFLFSVDKRSKHVLSGTNNQNAICCYANHGPVFGKSSSFIDNQSYYLYDLFVNIGSENGGIPCSSSMGNTFSLPSGISPGSKEARMFLAGATSFTISQIEVYAVTPKRGFN